MKIPKWIHDLVVPENITKQAAEEVSSEKEMSQMSGYEFANFTVIDPSKEDTKVDSFPMISLAVSVRGKQVDITGRTPISGGTVLVEQENIPEPLYLKNFNRFDDASENFIEIKKKLEELSKKSETSDAAQRASLRSEVKTYFSELQNKSDLRQGVTTALPEISEEDLDASVMDLNKIAYSIKEGQKFYLGNQEVKDLWIGKNNEVFVNIKGLPKDAGLKFSTAVLKNLKAGEKLEKIYSAENLPKGFIFSGVDGGTIFETNKENLNKVAAVRDILLGNSKLSLKEAKEKLWNDFNLFIKYGEEWKEHIPGGKAEGHKPEEFEKKELAKGIKVEMEHTPDPKVSKEISMDHIIENNKKNEEGKYTSTYYEELAKAEKRVEEAKKEEIEKEARVTTTTTINFDENNKQVSKTVQTIDEEDLKKEASEGIPPHIYNEVVEGIKAGKSYEDLKKEIEEKFKGFEFKKEDYEEGQKAIIAKIASVQHKPGHKDSKGEVAPWVIISEKGGRVISSHKTKAEAQKHLKDVQMFKHIKKAKLVFDWALDEYLIGINKYAFNFDEIKNEAKNQGLEEEDSTLLIGTLQQVSNSSLEKEAKVIVQSLFFDTVDEAITYQEKMQPPKTETLAEEKTEELSPLPEETLAKEETVAPAEEAIALPEIPTTEAPADEVKNIEEKLVEKKQPIPFDEWVQMKAQKTAAKEEGDELEKGEEVTVKGKGKSVVAREPKMSERTGNYMVEVVPKSIPKKDVEEKEEVKKEAINKSMEENMEDVEKLVKIVFEKVKEPLDQKKKSQPLI